MKTYTVKEAAKISNMSESWWRLRIKNKEIKYLQKGKKHKILIPQSTIDEVLSVPWLDDDRRLLKNDQNYAQKGTRFQSGEIIIEATGFYFRLHSCFGNRLIPAFKFIVPPEDMLKDIEIVIYDFENLQRSGFTKIS